MPTLTRSPAFDLALTTRVLSVAGMEEMASPAPLGKGKWYGVDRNPATGTMVAEFDCPADAWFFAGAPRDDVGGAGQVAGPAQDEDRSSQ